MKSIIIPKDKIHLKKIIKSEIFNNGLQCDLNHIDVSNIKDMKYLFSDSEFNGDISKWDVSNVECMYCIFNFCKFNGNISNWNVSKVEDMRYMFHNSEFSGDISDWKPYKLKNIILTFSLSLIKIPYWGKFENQKERKKAIDSYYLQKELAQDLMQKNNNQEKWIKI